MRDTTTGATRSRVALFFGLRYEWIYRWFLNHPSRVSWIVVELFLRRLPLCQRISNAWWQLRHYGDCEAFDALFQTYNRSVNR